MREQSLVLHLLQPKSASLLRPCKEPGGLFDFCNGVLADRQEILSAAFSYLNVALLFNQ